jgi:hypothetical protein
MSSESISLSGTVAARRTLLEKVYGWLSELLCVATLIGLQCTSLPGQSQVSEPAVNLGDTIRSLTESYVSCPSASTALHELPFWVC